MLIKLEPQDGYFDFTHDIVVPGELNDPEDLRTWDWDGPEEGSRRKKCRLNGSSLLSAKELGVVIRLLVFAAKRYGSGGYEYVDLSEEKIKCY
jgi:hypothetical protein